MTFVRRNLEGQIRKLPQKVQWCKLCLMSNQRPRIYFNEEGICSGCMNADYKKTINWKDREKELRDLLDKHRRKDGYWDVIVPSSGGKDSAYVAHQLRYKYNMNPLTVTWAPLEYTNIGWKNFQSLINSGLSNILCTPNGILQKKLSRLCFEELGDTFHVFVLGQVNYPFHLALKYGIKLVFYGENGELEYAGDSGNKDKPFKPANEWINQYFKGNNFNDLLNYGLKNKNYLNNDDYCEPDLIFYKTPNLDEMESSNIEGRYFYSYYHKWSPQENFYYASQFTGFQPNPERSEGTYSKYASLDDKMDGFHFYMRYIKFGLGRCVEDVSQEIRDGHITREEGLALAKKYEGEFPERYFNEFLKYLNIDKIQFWEIVDSWRSSHLWKKNGNNWELRYPIV